MDEVSKIRITCPYCGYKMPISCDSTSSSHGLYVRCKGSHCKREFEVVVKNGTQYKRPWIYEKVSGVFRYLF